MRIAHVITRLIRGGADENTVISANCQARDGHEVHLVCGAEISQGMAERLHSSVRLHKISDLVRPIKPFQDVMATIRLISLFRALRPDVVHTHTSKAGVLGRIAAKIAGAPGVVHGVHILPFLNVRKAEFALYLGLERLLAPVTDAFVNVSEGMRDAGVASRVGHPDRHIVIPSGMDIERFREAEPISAEDVASVFGRKLDPDQFRLIVMVAALEPRKRVVEFLDVFAHIVAVDNRAFLAVLGEGGERFRILDRAAELGISDRLALLGYRNDVERWVAAADVCVLASEREGLPRAVVQYALAARPAVVTALPGVEVIVQHGKTGFMVPLDQLHEMAAPILRLLSEDGLAKLMATCARSLDLSHWSDNRMVSELEQVYMRVLGTRRNQSPLRIHSAVRG